MASPAEAAAKSHQCGCSESEFIRAKNGRFDNVFTAFQAAVNSQRDSTTQIIQQQRLLDFSKSALPRSSDVFHRK
jgi:hypothetical protein